MPSKALAKAPIAKKQAQTAAADGPENRPAK
jgi:hypothetical protein